MMPEEEEALRKKEAVKERLHKAYIRRKADGTQVKYEATRKAKIKAEREVRNAAVRAEDIANGGVIPAKDLPNQEPKRAGEGRPNV